MQWPALLLAFPLAAQPAIHVNQAGYLPRASKTAIVAHSDAAEFAVLQAGKPVHKGKLSAPLSDPDTGETVRRADFTTLTKPGEYVLEVAGAKSPAFRIAPDVYQRPFYLAMRSFYGQRCGIDVDLGGGYQYTACHRAGEFHPSSGKSGPKTNTGGWHDAGDYGRYVVNSGITTGTLLLAYELFGAKLGRIRLDIPESNNQVPDHLDETRWNLNWMLSMQDADGGAWHKQTTPKFSGFVMPQHDTMPSVVIGAGAAPFKSSCATADFAAVMAIAARVYRPFDKAFSETTAAAAQKAWQWLEQNPNVLFRNPPGVSTGEYGDRDCSDERLWAAAELLRSTNSSAAAQYFLANYQPLLKHLRPSGPPSWSNVAAIALWSYALHPSADPAAAKTIRAAALEAAEALATRTLNAPYRNSMTTEDYIWGSNAVAANYSFQLLIANTLQPNPRFTEAALENLHYLLGRNTFGTSWLTAVGARPFMKPHHRPSGADNIAAPWPGLLSGGPNRRKQDPAMRNMPDAPPARMWLDDQESYASNEIAINWNAPLVFLLASAIP